VIRDIANLILLRVIWDQREADRFKAVALRATPLIRHASHDTFPRKGGRGTLFLDERSAHTLPLTAR
jgi:hypothetical protein